MRTETIADGFGFIRVIVPDLFFTGYRLKSVQGLIVDTLLRQEFRLDVFLNVFSAVFRHCAHYYIFCYAFKSYIPVLLYYTMFFLIHI